MWAEIGANKSSNVKLLGVTIDNRLNFDSHSASICLKANPKLTTLSRFAKLLSFD